MYSDDILVHYGILGMRWGVRRYQNRDGSLTAEGRKRLGVKEGSPRHKPSNAKKLAKQRADNLAKARKAKEEKRIHEEKKQAALANGNATEVLKYKGELSQQELRAAYNRIDLERQLSSIAASETKSAWDKMDSLVNKMGKVKNYADKGIEAYNLLAKIHNSFATDEEAWKPIDGNSKTDETKKKEKKEKEKDLVDYISKYGNLDQVTKYLDQMSTKDAKSAIKRFIPDNSKEAAEKSKLILEIIVDHGKNKQVFSNLDAMSVSQLKQVKARLDQEKAEQKNQKNQKKEEDDD